MRRNAETEAEKALNELKERSRSRWSSSAQREKDVEEAQRILRADYYHDVNLHAEDLLERVVSGEIRDPERFDEALHEECDGSGRVIYTYKAKQGLLASDNEDAYEEEMGEPAPGPEQAMYFALRADIMEQLSAFGFDPSDEDSYGEEEE